MYRGLILKFWSGKFSFILKDGVLVVRQCSLHKERLIIPHLAIRIDFLEKVIIEQISFLQIGWNHKQSKVDIVRKHKRLMGNIGPNFSFIEMLFVFRHKHCSHEILLHLSDSFCWNV